MKSCRLGNSQIMLSQIIMGTWQAGKAMWSGIDDNETTKAIKTAFDSGITTFDTAEQYGNGHSEMILGDALKGERDRVVYATKVAPQNLSRPRIIEACNNSLKNLGTDYIDIYQIHWPSGSWGSEVVPIEETMEAMDDLKKQGKIRAIGVSNFSTAQLKEAMSFGDILSIQPPCSLFWRHAEKEIIPYGIEHNLTILAYSPMAQGVLTGRFKEGHKFPKKDHRSKNKLFRPENIKRVQEALVRLSIIAEKNNASLGQLALAWVISHSGTCAIAGARNPDQVLQNAKAPDIFLSEEDLAEMDLIGRSVTDPMDDNPVMWG
ncbi:aldo/keto reductase [Thermodesulfobacteriota bacterium]